MKKFYSLVLMAAALLVSTSISAKNFTGTTRAELQKAIADIIYGVESDSEIKLQNPVDLDGTIWVGTQKLDGSEGNEYKSITLDLNGNDITYSGTSGDRTLIALTHGELKIVNRASKKAKLQLTGTSGGGATIISVYGSSKSSRWAADGSALVGAGTNTRVQGWCSHLEVGSNVLLYAEQGCQGTGLYVGTAATLWYPKANGDGTYTLAKVDYISQMFVGSAYSFAHGARVDFSGEINFQGDNAGKAYGIKVNGTTRSPLSCVNSGNEAIKSGITDTYFTSYYGKNEAIDKTATDATDATHQRDTVDAPFIWVHPSAEIKTRNAGDKVTALYAAGYAKWLVQGYAAGKTGMYVSSGVIDLEDGYIKSTAETWENTSNIGSANGGGSGVVLNSRDSYSGGIEFTVSGDSKIESIAGYGIEEAVNTTVVVPNPNYDPEHPEEHPEFIPDTKASSVVIEGGTISGGDKGAVVISGPTSESTKGDPENPNTATVVVYGGNFEGTTVVGTDGDLDDLLPESNQYHTTEVTVTDPVTGQTKTTIVISEGSAPSVPEPGEGNSVIGADENTSIKWINTVTPSETLTTDLTLKEVEINEDYAQTLIIGDATHDVTFKVGRMILGEKAQIIVNPGSQLIVDGAQGIVAPKTSNILVKSTADKQGYFIFNPDVTSNRHPNATVEVYTNCKQLESTPKKIYTYQRIAIPVMSTGKPANDFSGSLFPGQSSFGSYAWQWNGYIWAAISSWGALEPFVGYQFANNSAAGGVTYSFAGELVGNGDATYEFPTGGYDYFGCSHVAPIYVDSLFKHFASNMEATAWVYDFSISQYKYINAEQIADGFAPEEIKPMEAFVLRIKAQQGTSGMNYKSAIWGNPRFDAVLGRPSQKNNAPARSRVSTSNRAIVNVTAENGYADNVTLVEKDTYTTEFDNGADASKLMFAEGINLYATTEAGELARVATDDLLGTLLSFRSGVSTEYTINLTNVLGEDYALRDNVTGQVIVFAEGATYTFMQDANTTVPARFEVVEAAKLPTAIGNVEESAEANGIYTITGQYMGRDFTKVPAGIYIVNGVKVVK